MTEERILSEITARRDALISLTQDLIRIPTLNPPGRNYREICDYLAARLGTQFTVEFIRAKGAPGDSDQYPRWNLLARREGRQLSYQDVRARVAAQMANQARAKALQQYMRLLVGQASVEGLALEGADSPLLQ